jgi:hypothetical protein
VGGQKAPMGGNSRTGIAWITERKKSKKPAASVMRHSLAKRARKIKQELLESEKILWDVEFSRES